MFQEVILTLPVQNPIDNMIGHRIKERFIQSFLG